VSSRSKKIRQSRSLIEEVDDLARKTQPNFEEIEDLVREAQRNANDLPQRLYAAAKESLVGRCAEIKTPARQACSERPLCPKCLTNLKVGIHWTSFTDASRSNYPYWECAACAWCKETTLEELVQAVRGREMTLSESAVVQRFLEDLSKHLRGTKPPRGRPKKAKETRRFAEVGLVVERERAKFNALFGQKERLSKRDRLRTKQIRQKLLSSGFSTQQVDIGLTAKTATIAARTLVAHTMSLDRDSVSEYHRAYLKEFNGTSSRTSK